MSGRIPQHFLDSLLAKVDIVDVIGRYIDLKKQGSNYSACCPFHQEKTPSFTVTPSKQFYYCFGCGAHGNAIGFVKEYNRLDFVEAVEDLAHSAGMEVPREAVKHFTPAKKNELQQLYDLLQKAAKFYQWQLRQSSNQEAVEYFKSRGLTGEIAKNYGLGYAPHAWDHLNKTLNPHGKLDALMQKAGLTIQGKSGCYDRFRHRVMFPIRDRRGRVIGFGGRVLTADEQPKYLNSPETPVFHKNRELYGLYEALQTSNTLNYAIVVEGYMDVIALAQAGIHNAVATLGTATNEEHVRILSKQTKHIVFCFDGDTAGRQAAWRALNSAIPHMTGELRVEFLFLPEGEDPDTTIRQNGSTAFEALLHQAKPLSVFLLSTLQENLNLRSIDGRALLLNKALPYLQKLPEGTFKALLLEQLAQLCQVSVPKILQQLAPTPDQNTPQIQERPLNTVEQAIALLVQEPSLVNEISDIEWHPQDSNEHLLLDLVTFIKNQKIMHSSSLFQHWPSSESSRRLALLASKKNMLKNSNNSLEIRDLFTRISQSHPENELEKLLYKSKSYKLSEEEKQKIRLLIQQTTKS